MMTHVKPRPRALVISREQRRRLEIWAENRGKASTVAAILSSLRGKSASEERWALRTMTWEQMADMAGVRRY